MEFHVSSQRNKIIFVYTLGNSFKYQSFFRDFVVLFNHQRNLNISNRNKFPYSSLTENLIEHSEDVMVEKSFEKRTME